MGNRGTGVVARRLQHPTTEKRPKMLLSMTGDRARMARRHALAAAPQASDLPHSIKSSSRFEPSCCRDAAPASRRRLRPGRRTLLPTGSRLGSNHSQPSHPKCCNRQDLLPTGLCPDASGGRSELLPPARSATPKNTARLTSPYTTLLEPTILGPI
jgi:hypothetical protein